MEEELITNQQGETPVDDSQPANFIDLIKERAFLGEVPKDIIFEKIRTQFEDYINHEDSLNYVDIFYTQLASSYDRVENDDSEEYPNEIFDVLQTIYQTFIDLMKELFSTRLTITINDLEGDNINHEDLELTFRRLYEFFILGAQNNFKVVISKDIGESIHEIQDDDQYFQELQKALQKYSPLIVSMTSEDFLRRRGDKEILELFESGKVTGNFLRKYSPKLYQNEEFGVELVNYITMIHQFQQDVIDSEIE